MFYTIYKITNTLNNKIYIGKHKTKDLNDEYMGSGKLLKRAIEKHGIDKFQKQILFVFDNEEDMNKKEKEIVNSLFVEDKKTYNLCIGGKGGFSYINDNGLGGTLGYKHSEETKLHLSRIASGRKLKEETKQKISLSRSGKNNPMYGKDPWNKNKTHSCKTKEKMKLSSSGEKNSQYNTMWITNGKENKKIKNTEKIPVDWYKGRTTIQK